MKKTIRLTHENDSNGKCHRCKSRTAVFYCQKCEIYQVFCRFCDTYVHGLPSKKEHPRLPIELVFPSTEGEEMEKQSLNQRIINTEMKRNHSQDYKQVGSDKGILNTTPNMNQLKHNSKSTNKIKLPTNNNTKNNLAGNRYRQLTNTQNTQANLSNKKNSMNIFTSQTNREKRIKENEISLSKNNEMISKTLHTSTNDGSIIKNNGDLLENYNNISKSKIYSNLNSNNYIDKSSVSNKERNKENIGETTPTLHCQKSGIRDFYKSHYKTEYNNEVGSNNNYDESLNNTIYTENNFKKFCTEEEENENVNNNNNKETSNHNQTNLTQNNLDINNQNNNTQKSVLMNIQSTYSREYVNELRSIFLREKNELIFKNNTMQNTLDKLKNSFSEQISLMTNEIEENNRKHQFSLKALEENIDSYYKTIILEKENTIDEMNEKIKSLLDSNRNLSSRLNSSEIAYEGLVEKLKAMEEYFQNEVQKRDSEILSLKNQLSVVERNNYSEKEDLQNKIKSDFDEKMNELILNFQAMQEKSKVLLDEKEKEIENLNKGIYENTNQKERETEELKEEINCHKQNLICYRERRLELESEIKNLKEIVENYKKDSKMKNHEVKILESQNEDLIKENDEIKIQLNKLDKLVYGKIRSNNSSTTANVKFKN